MRRAQYYFFVSPPLRMMWLIAGSILWARRHGPVAAFFELVLWSHVFGVAVAVCGKLRTKYVRVRPIAVLAWLLGPW